MSSFKLLSNQSLNLYLWLKGSIPILRFMAQGIDPIPIMNPLSNKNNVGDQSLEP